ncbi:RNA polymerase sigma factor [Sphingomonas oryzagri]
MSDGLQAIFLSNRATLLRFVAARGAGDEAEDVLQELWIKVAGAPSGPIASPLSYLFRAAENLMRDRHRASRQAILRDHAWEETHSPAAPGVSDAPSGERLLIAREELARIEAALAAIGDRARDVFRLHRIEGIAQRDIAARMGVSLSTVESDMRKAYRAVLEAREGAE